MSTTVGGVAGSSATERSEGRKGLINFKSILAGAAAIAIIFAVARWYQQWASWEFGLDSTEAVFDVYWMTVFWAEVTLIPLFGLGTAGYLWMTRDLNVFSITPREELKRYFNLVGMLFVFAFTFMLAVIIFGEQDAAWHQTVVRDTSFTPSHIFLFYGSIPVAVCLGTSAFMYARTRIPAFAEAWSVPFIVAVTGPFMVLPTVAYNEWGHAFWLMEEYFTVPLHWGFVVMGWAIICLGGLILQVMGRLGYLIEEVTKDSEQV